LELEEFMIAHTSDMDGIHMQSIKLQYYINRTKLDNIMRNILLNFCEVSVIGYNNLNKNYWFKICENKYCVLHAEIEILYKNSEISELNILPLVGNINTIKKFVYDINEALYLYQSSLFVRGSLSRV
jgi:hypothetical protein